VVGTEGAGEGTDAAEGWAGAEGKATNPASVASSKNLVIFILERTKPEHPTQSKNKTLRHPGPLRLFFRNLEP
jgi:hypothetical protein